MSRATDDQEPSSWAEARVAGALMLALASLLVRPLALAAVLVTLVVFLSLPALEGGRRVRALAALALSAAAAVTASIWFLIADAMPKIVVGGEVAVEQSALWRLREIVRAEDAMRTMAMVDPDRDGVGSAALVGELMGLLPLRGLRALDPPLLSRQYARLTETPLGPAAVANAYLLVVCLPTKSGGLTALPADAIDEERAERRFVAYAWPMKPERVEGLGRAYFVDEHEQILVSKNRGADGQSLWAGPNHSPPCDAALADPTRASFRVWRGKKPRSSLPGDRS